PRRRRGEHRRGAHRRAGGDGRYLQAAQLHAPRRAAGRPALPVLLDRRGRPTIGRGDPPGRPYSEPPALEEPTMTARRVRFLATDIWEMPENGNRYEVIDGELFVTPPPGSLHQLAVTTLAALIREYIAPRGLGVVLVAPTGVILDEYGGVEPDLVYISRER